MTNQMQDEFEKYCEKYFSEIRLGDIRHAFTAAYSLQQEKIEILERELHQQRFNNKHNLSIDGVIAEKIRELEARLNQLNNVELALCDEQKRAQGLENKLKIECEKLQVAEAYTQAAVLYLKASGVTSLDESEPERQMYFDLKEALEKIREGL